MTADEIAARLDQIRERHAASTEGTWIPYDLGEATEGPTQSGKWFWVWREDKLPYYGGVFEADNDYTILSDDGKIWYVDGAVGVVNTTDGRDHVAEQADAEFIAHAHQDLPLLVDTLDSIVNACVVSLRSSDYGEQRAASHVLSIIKRKFEKADND